MATPDIFSYPLRLSDLERQKLQLMVAALKVSEYTDNVDDYRRPQNMERRAVVALREFMDIVTGLAIAADAIPRSTKEVLLSSEAAHTSALAPLLEDLCEIVRRHKRLNPASHHGEYGKLVMILQDVQRRSVRSALGLSSNLMLPIRTVGTALTSLSCEQFALEGALIKAYVRGSGAAKQEALVTLLNKYDKGNPEQRGELERVLRSIDDVHQLMQANTEPLLYLRHSLECEFRRVDVDAAHSLAIRRGCEGACLSHNHTMHAQYVAESLLLWEKVQRAIFDMWTAAEDDMIIDGGGCYDFCNTGQGYHRMCRAPKSYAVMSRCVREAEQEMGGWVGIKVIHLGDRDVPNSLVFIDKYTLIPRIVQPVVQAVRMLESFFDDGDSNTSSGSVVGVGSRSANDTVSGSHPTASGDNSSNSNGGCVSDGGNSLDEAAHGRVASPRARDKYPGLCDFLRHKYHSYAQVRMSILTDFFRHAFDGSGDDGGNCIDGRLTSAWNWCHQLHKKSYCDAFVLTGFSGFD